MNDDSGGVSDPDEATATREGSTEPNIEGDPGPPDAKGDVTDPGAVRSDDAPVDGGAAMPVDEESRALTPLSIPYRSVRRGASIAFTLLFFVVSGSSVIGGAVGQLVGLALIGLTIVALIAYEVSYWRRYEYALTADTFDIRSGVFRR